jgi:uncharacterized protein YuzE
MSHDVYVYFAPKGTRVARTVEVTVDGIRTPVLIDIGHEQQIVGVEMSNAKRIDVDGRDVMERIDDLRDQLGQAFLGDDW